MLPATFENTTPSDLKVPTQVIGIFAAALLTAGFSTTFLLCFAVPNPLFRIEAIFQPGLAACFVGLLTVVYDFLLFSRYRWNVPAFLTTVAAGVGCVVYGVCQVWTRRRVSAVGKKAKEDGMAVPLRMPSTTSASASAREREGTSTPGLLGAEGNGNTEEGRFQYQDTAYYDNYARNMFPSALPPASNRGGSEAGTFDPHAVPEEELQRQQMLNLLLQQRELEQRGEGTAGEGRGNATYRIDIPVPGEDDSPSEGFGMSIGRPSPLSAHVRLAAASEVRAWDERVLREVDRRRRGG
jgi:hypothetical protein